MNLGEVLMKRNREGYLVSSTERECTLCGCIFPNTSKTVTLCGTCNTKRVTEQSPEVKMYRRAKSRVSKNGMDFNITKYDINIPEVCPILGIPLVVHTGRSGGYNDSPALDRIDNSKGYIQGNVWVISHLANKMKADSTKEQLVKFCEWVLDNKDKLK